MIRSRPLALALATLVAPALAGAQGFSQASFRVAPQYLSYSLDIAGTKTKINQLAIPVAFAMPLTSKLSFDIATAFANASVDNGSTKSSISGLTDAQVRLNWTQSEALVITAGVNLPTGSYDIPADKIDAAAQIGNDFLAFPVSSFGNGFAATGGVAFAKPLGTWNLGLGASFRKSAEFGAYEDASTSVRFTPADEIRLRAGLDREVSGGRVAFGLVYSSFGDDSCTGCEGTSNTTYSTGARIIGQGGLDLPVGNHQLYVGGWMLHHAEGKNVSGNAPAENIMNLLLALGLNLGERFLEPSLEIRKWSVDGTSAGSLLSFGVRTKFTSGSLELSPSAAFGTGSLGSDTKADLTQIKVGMTIRLVR